MLVRFPYRRNANDNEPWCWLVCNECKEPAIIAKLDAGLLVLLCAACGHDLTEGLLNLAYPEPPPKPTG
jgi:hypothetical protein